MPVKDLAAEAPNDMAQINAPREIFAPVRRLNVSRASSNNTDS